MLEARTQASVALFKLGAAAHSATLRPSVYFFCLGGPDAGEGRIGLGPPVGVFPLFKLELSQQKKKFSAEITMSTLPKWLI